MSSVEQQIILDAMKKLACQVLPGERRLGHSKLVYDKMRRTITVVNPHLCGLLITAEDGKLETSQNEMPDAG